MRRILKTASSALAFAVIALAGRLAFAQGTVSGSDGGLLPIGAGLAIGLAALGGALGQGRAAGAALDGIARNPQASGKIITPMIIGLALIESLVLIGFVVANGLAGKIGGH